MQLDYPVLNGLPSSELASFGETSRCRSRRPHLRSRSWQWSFGLIV